MRDPNRKRSTEQPQCCGLGEAGSQLPKGGGASLGARGDWTPLLSVTRARGEVRLALFGLCLESKDETVVGRNYRSQLQAVETDPGSFWRRSVYWNRSGSWRQSRAWKAVVRQEVCVSENMARFTFWDRRSGGRPCHCAWMLSSVVALQATGRQLPAPLPLPRIPGCSHRR